MKDSCKDEESDIVLLNSREEDDQFHTKKGLIYI